MDKKTIYVLGNILVDSDSLPLKILPELEKYFTDVKFAIVDPNENFPPEGEKDLLILDTVKGIAEPMILDLGDFGKTKNTPVSPHDYDLLFHLLLMKKLGKINSVKMVGVPQGAEFAKIIIAVKDLISQII